MGKMVKQFYFLVNQQKVGLWVMGNAVLNVSAEKHNFTADEHG